VDVVIQREAFCFIIEQIGAPEIHTAFHEISEFPKLHETPNRCVRIFRFDASGKQ